MNPKKMQALMKQMGIDQQEIDARRVVIEKDGGKLVILEPSVVRVRVQGQETFQISGQVTEEEAGISDDDVKTVMEKTGATEEQSRESLQKTGDLAESILELSG